MTIGPGRIPKNLTVSATYPLTREQVAMTPRAQNSNAVQTFRDSHHLVARLFALGLRPGEVAQRAGYSLARVSTLSADPAFQELVACYRNQVNDSFKEAADEYYETITANRIIAARLLNDKLTAGEADDFSVSQLVSVHADAADRTGYPKRSVAVNVNVDFAAKLDLARKRSAAVQPPRITSLPSQDASGVEVGDQGSFGPPDPPLRRRA